MVAILKRRRQIGDVARFLISVREGKVGPVIATQEVDERTLIEVSERFFEFGSTFGRPCVGKGVALDAEANALVGEAVERLPPHVRELLERGLD